MESSGIEHKANTPEDARWELANYHSAYRHPDLRPLKLSGLYDLRPEDPPNVDASLQFCWSAHHAWPHGNRAGVYLIWDDALSLRYVGRATVLGKRLHSHFGAGKRCRFAQGWLVTPRYLATIPVEHSFEAGSLEEYLMTVLMPAENATPWHTEWVNKRDRQQLMLPGLFEECGDE